MVYLSDNAKKFCREWSRERNWIVSMGYDPTDIAEEQQASELIYKFRFVSLNRQKKRLILKNRRRYDRKL